MSMHHKALLICKRHVDTYGISYGLINSATFVTNALVKQGIDICVTTVVDANQIDREIHRHRATHVILEAIWVTPEKLEELVCLHRHKKWIVRVHSRAPFIANEGIALSWLFAYKNLAAKHPQLHISCNNEDFNEELSQAMGLSCIYLPNIYAPTTFSFKPPKDKEPNVLDIGCFGAIRPLKNHLSQAMAAVIVANKLNTHMRFHINAGRVEQKGDQVLKNLRALFTNSQYELIEHPWMPHAEFINLVRNMDVGMQVSLTESFNIVAADFVDNNVPIIVSKDIHWISKLYQCDPTSVMDIAKALIFALKNRSLGLHVVNKMALSKYNAKSSKIWEDYFS